MFQATTRIEKLKKRKTWRLLSATDFVSLMRPCFFMCWLLGVFPYKCEPPTFKLSKIRFTFSTFTILIYVISLIGMIYQINFTTIISSNTPNILDKNLYIFLDGIAIIAMYTLTDARLFVLQNLSKVSSMLSSKDFNELAKIVHTKDVVGFLCLIVHVPNCFKGNVYLTFMNICNLYIMVVNFVLDMFYMNCVCTLKICFKKMNECIEELKPEIDDDLWSQMFTHPGQKNHLLLMKLKNLEEKHLMISDVVQLVNNTFLIRIIIMSASTFTVVTFNLFFQMINVHNDLPVNRKYWFFSYISVAAFCFIKFAMMIWACETATNQAKKIKTTVHNVFSGTTNPRMKREEELFSLQLLHTNNTFTAKAIEMNAMLLARIFGGIVMYIMILFQFLLNTIMCYAYTKQKQDFAN